MIGSLHKRSRRNEDGVEAAAMMIVIPVLAVMIFALIDISVMFSARGQVSAVARDVVRSAAYEGGNSNPRTTTNALTWSQIGTRQLYTGGRCTVSRCRPGQQPTMTCNRITRPNGAVYTSNVADRAGDLITCTVNYPYRGMNEGLLNSPMGLGFGSLIKPFTVSASARAETGRLS